MKKSLFYALFSFLLCCNIFALAEIDAGVKADIVARIKSVQEPFISDNYMIFTAQKNTRFVGIAFGFEDYMTIHPFERRVQRDDDGTENNSILFYILPLPKNANRIDYRLVIDGMWTFDPVNSHRVYDPEVNTLISVIHIDKTAEPITEKQERGSVRFVCDFEPNQRIRLAGSFNNWDSFMYDLEEVSPGHYVLDLPLPKGSYHYAFYNGMSSFPDKTNPIRAYTQDGKIASYIKVD